MTEHADLEVRRDVAAMTDDELKRTFSVAKALALSKRFPDARTADEAFAKILVGRDLGLSPTQALTGLHIVEGRPQIAAVTLAGFVRKSGQYDYSIDTHTEEVCAIRFWRNDDEIGMSTFTIAEAKTAGLVKDKSNWVQWPKNMLFARAMSNGVKWFCPDLMGGVPIYTEADVFEGTASELAAGEGSGEPVGWKGISDEQAAQLEYLLKFAEGRGHAGFAHRPTVEMIVNGQSYGFISDWIRTALDQLADMKVTPKRAQEAADVLLDAAEAPAEPTRAEDLERRRDELRDEIGGISHLEGHVNDEHHDALLVELADVEARLNEQIPDQESLDVEEAER